MKNSNYIRTRNRLANSLSTSVFGHYQSFRWAVIILQIVPLLLFSTCKQKDPPPKPKAFFTYSPSSNLVAPVTINFQNKSTNATSYGWYYGPGTNDNSFNKDLTLTFRTGGQYTIKLDVTGEGGKDSYSEIITIAAPVTTTPPSSSTSTTQTTAGFTYSPSQNLVAPARITFTNTSRNADSYRWDFGDGTTATSINPVKEYTRAGNYKVKLTAVGKNNSAESTADITLNAQTPTDNTGTITFWTKTDLKVGKINVTVNGISQGTITQFHTNGVTCGQGNVNAKFNAGTYQFKATAENGTTWQDNITFERGICKTWELWGNTPTNPPTGGGNCDWNSAVQCVKVTKALVGTRCGTSNSVDIEYQNICTTNIKVVCCIQNANGTWNCLPDGKFDAGLKPNEKAGHFVCAGTAKYKIYAMPITSFLNNKCSYPKE